MADSTSGGGDGIQSSNAEAASQAGGPAIRQAATETLVETPEMQGIRAMASALVQCGGLTREQADKMIESDLRDLRSGAPAGFPPDIADAWVASGAMTREEADELIGLSAAQRAAALDLPKLADPLGDLQLEPDFDRPATPAEYRFPPAKAEGASLESVRDAQRLAWQARMPVPIAMEMFKLADGYTGKPLDAGAIALLSATNHAKLERMWGEETQAKIELGRRFIAELQAVNPRVMPLMDTGLGSDLGFVLLLVAHAERVAFHRKAS